MAQRAQFLLFSDQVSICSKTFLKFNFPFLKETVYYKGCGEKSVKIDSRKNRFAKKTICKKTIEKKSLRDFYLAAGERTKRRCAAGRLRPSNNIFH